MDAFLYDRLSVSEADDLARVLTRARMRVRLQGKNVMLCCDRQRAMVHLLPYQLTLEGIENVIAENEPWPGQSDFDNLPLAQLVP